MGRLVTWYRHKGATYGWIALFLLPFLVLYGAFTLWPLVATAIYSLFDWNGIGPLTQHNYLGLQNYQELWHDPLFWQAFGNTLFIAITNTVIKVPLSLFVAIVLTRRWLWFKAFFRTVFFLPIVLPVSLAGQIFTFLLDPSNGAFNSFLLKLGVIKQPIDILGHASTATWAIILISAWQIFGQYMLYWMAALQNVPEDLYEAAEIDGASEWHKLIHITLPVIRPVAVIISLLAIANALRIFDVVVTLTSGGPGTGTYVNAFYIYQEAFVNFPFRYGYASAVAVLFAILAFFFVLTQGVLTRDRRQNVSLFPGGRA